MAVAELGYVIDSSGAITATKNLDIMAASAIKAESAANVLASGAKSASANVASFSTAVSSTSTSLSSVQQQTTAAAASFKGLGADIVATQREAALYRAEMDAVRAQFNPLFAASKQYEAQLERIASAERMGAISTREAAAAREKAAAMLSTVGNAAETAGKKSFLAGNGFRNIALQLNQVGQQTAASGDLLRSFTIQLPDLLLGFGTMGIVIGALAPAIVGFASGMLGASKDADELADGLDDLNDAISEYKQAAVSGADASQYLLDNFGNITKETIALAAAMQELRVREIMLDAAEASNALADTFSGGLRSEVARLNSMLSEGKDWWDDNSAAALQFAGRLETIRTAKGPADQLAAVKAMRDEFVKITGGIDNMTDSQREYYSSVLQTEQALTNAVNLTFDAAAATSDWDITMQGVKVELNAIAAIIASLGGGAISAAAKQTEISALRAGATVKQAAVAASEFKENLRVDAEVAQLEARWGVIGTAVGAVVKHQSEYNMELDRTLDAERTAAMEREKAAAKAGRSSGGGASKKEGNEYQRDIESLITSLQTERETVDAWYAESQAILNDRRAVELLGVQGHNDAKLALEAEYQERLAGLRTGYNGTALDQAGQFFGDMASAMASGNDKMVALSQAFASIEALINAYRAYNQVIADPTLPWFAKIPAAAGVLAAGMKTVSSIKSLSGSGSSSTSSSVSTSSSAPTAASTTTTTAQTRTIVQIQSSRRSFTVDEINDIIAGIQDEAGDGVIIEGFTLA